MFNFKSMKLAWKLPLMIAVPAILVVMASGALQLKQAADAISEDQKVAYSSYVEEKSVGVERWLDNGRRDVLALGMSFAVKQAVRDFSSGWNGYSGAVSDELRRLYITDNPNPIGEKDELTMAFDGSAWSSAHNRHHEGLRAYQRGRGYYDLFLFDPSGNLIYSVFKEDDFALNFNQGKYSDSGLGEAFKSAKNLQADQFHMTDIAAYAPSADAPAMFMSAPVFENDTLLGVVAIQLPMDVVFEILTSSDLLGETGEAYLVDNNGVALTNSRRDGLFSALDRLPDLAQIGEALRGQSAYFENTAGVDGHPVVAQTAEVKTPRGDHWGMVFEIDRAEAMTFAREATFTAVIELAITALLLCALVWWALRGVTKRIDGLNHEMEQIAEQNYHQEIAGQDRMDEIGFISRTLANLQVRLLEGVEAQEREKVVQEANAKVVDVLSETLLDLAKGDFRNQILEHFPEEHKKLRYSINDAMDALSAVIEAVRGTAESIHQGAEEISTSADNLSKRTESQAATLEQTAAALEQVTTSVRSATEHAENVEITVDNAREKAEASGAVVKETIQAMTEIEQSSNQINQIISVIDDIAFQTNLLALNAGVEAARAGEAGRGFAVVASEVRGLAQRSSDAAREIKTLIEASGQQVGRGVKMVGRTGEALNSIVDQVQEISELVKQIAHSSRDQSTALTEINSGMTQLDRVTQENAAMVEENTAASHLLRSDADRLRQDVGKFKTSDTQHASSAAGFDSSAGQNETEVFEEDSFETESEQDVAALAGPDLELDDFPKAKVANQDWGDF